MGGLRKGKIGNTRNTGKDGWLRQRAFSQVEAGQFCPPSMERGQQVTLTKTSLHSLEYQVQMMLSENKWVQLYHLHLSRLALD